MLRVMNLFLLLLIMQACSSQTSSDTEAIENQLSENVERKAVPDSLAKILTLDYVMGKYDPAKHEDFIEIPLIHADRSGLYLRKDTYAAFKAMYESAKQEGIILQIR